VLCDKADVSPARLERAELTEFVRLYRRASADLAWARSLSANTELAAFLNGLVGRAYGILYRRPRIRLLPALQSILATGAQVVRRRAWFIFASLAIFLFGIFSTAFIFATRPDLTHYFIQPGDPNLEHWKKGEFEERDVSTAFAATGMYSTNNPTVALRIGTFSAATFGFGTFYFMYANGALLGAYGYELAQVGHLDFLLVNVAPHGASELTGAIIAGASGLVLGWAMIAPGLGDDRTGPPLTERRLAGRGQGRVRSPRHVGRDDVHRRARRGVLQLQPNSPGGSESRVRRLDAHGLASVLDRLCARAPDARDRALSRLQWTHAPSALDGDRRV